MDHSKISTSTIRHSNSQGSIPIRCNSLPSAKIQRKSNYAVFDPGYSRQKILKQKSTDLPQSTLKDEHINLKQLVFNKQDRIVELEYFNTFLEDALKKREDITKACMEENVRLKEELKSKNKVIERLRTELRAIKNSFPTIEQRNSFTKGPRLPLERSIRITTDMTHSYRHHTETKNYFTERPEYSEIPHKLDTDAKSSRIPTEEDAIKMFSGPFPKITEDSAERLSTSRRQNTSMDRKSDSSGIMKRPFKAISTVVTELQGRRAQQSLFLDNFSRVSVLQMSDSEMESAFKDVNLLKIQNLLKKQNDEIVETLSSASEQEKNNIFDTLRAMDNDIKLLASVIGTLKKLLRASNSISVSLVLYDALERIVLETCEILNCDRASVFLVDHINRVLWTKVAKGAASTLKVPMDSGIVGAAATSGRAVRIDDAYLDDRFNKEIDVRTNYRTKTILAMPIKDITGNVIGVCQAINKLDNKLFTQDDEELFQILANQAGIMLKNLIKFDDTLVNHLKIGRLLQISMEMYQAKSLSSFLVAAETGLKGVFSSDKAIIYIVDENNSSFYRFDEEGNKMLFSMSTGLIGLTTTKKQLLDIKYPDDDPNYNNQVDIDTHLPLLCLPLLSHEGSRRMLAVMQVSDLQAAGSKLKSKGDTWEMENLKTFADIARMCIEKLVDNEEKMIYGGNKQNGVTAGMGKQGFYSIFKKEDNGKEISVRVTSDNTGTLDPSNELNVGRYQEEIVYVQEEKGEEKLKLSRRNGPKLG